MSMNQKQKWKQKLKKSLKRKNLENKLLAMQDKKVAMQTCKIYQERNGFSRVRCTNMQWVM